MKTPSILICCVVILSILGQFGKTLLGLAGVPNVTPVLRDLILFGLTLFGLSRIDLFAQRWLALALFLFLVMFAVYLMVSIVGDRQIVGLYYLRLYAVPVMFFLAMLGWVRHATTSEITSAVRAIQWFNVILALLAIVLYVALNLQNSPVRQLLGGDQIATAWFISGGTWMRMGLPASGPNSLGLFFGLNFLLFLSLLVEGRKDTTNRPALMIGMAVSVISLLLTFSRSSLLMVVAGALGVVSSAGRRSRLPAGSAVLLLTSVVVIGLVAVAMMDTFSDGYVMRWLELTLSLADPSIQGRGSSFVYAWNNLDEYFLFGYPRGTVGPKAFIFTGTSTNVENTFLGLFYDFGVPLGLLMCIAYFLLFREAVVRKPQVWLATAFLLCAQFLPYLFEPDAIMYFMFIFVLLGPALNAAQQRSDLTAQDIGPLAGGPRAGRPFLVRQ